MQLIGQIPEPVLAEMAGWLAVVIGFAACAALLKLATARSHRRGPVPVAIARSSSELEPGADWQKILDVSVELVRARDLRALHGDAATQIDAAEHAFNRLLAECSAATNLVVAPTREPLRQLARLPAATPARRPPLAA